MHIQAAPQAALPLSAMTWIHYRCAPGKQTPGCTSHITSWKIPLPCHASLAVVRDLVLPRPGGGPCIPGG